MLRAGTNVVGGVTPGKGGQKADFEGRALPVFNSVGEAMAETGADVTVIFVPPKFAKGAIIEAIDAAIPLAITITEGIPVHDTAAAWAHNLTSGSRTRIVGPNCPASPARASPTPASSRPTSPAPGRIGLVSKSGTLTYQMMYELRDIGFSTAVGIGGDPIIGTTHIDALAAFQADPTPTRS
jgi:succinyl-CoA synthetase alpha subunit